MSGLKRETLSFLKNLSRNNNREWFNANKALYEEAKRDFEQFVLNLIVGISEFDKSIGAVEPRDCIFRIYRDVRFSANKNPYKENFGAFIAPDGKKSRLCGYYIHIQPSSSFASGGLYMAPGATMKLVRTGMVEYRKEFLDIVNSPKFSSTFSFEGIETLKRTPAGFSFDEDLDFYLRLKHITPSRLLSDKELSNPRFTEDVIGIFRILSPLIKFLNHSIQQ